MKRLVGVMVALAGLVAILLTLGGPAASGGAQGQVVAKAAKGLLKPAKLTTPAGVTRTLPFLSDAAVASAQDALGIRAADERAQGADANGASDLGEPNIGLGEGTLGCARRDKGHDHGAGGTGNVRVNQDCTFRRQAEEDITYNPLDPNNLTAGQNDSRVGFNQCGIDWSTDNGTHWGDMLPPFRQKVNNPAAEEPAPPGDPNRHTIEGGDGTLHTYDAGSDPANAMDSLGRSFFSCVGFDVFSNASLVYVTQSPQGAEGSFYFNIGMFGRQFVVAEDNSPVVFHDKNMISADRYPSSPNAGNVYVTWTVFRFSASTGSYQRSPIFGSMSTDGGRHFSTPQEISGTSDTLCFFGNALDPTQPEHACNFDQGSYSVALPNGDLEVIFNNGNTPGGNPNSQQLGVHCHPTGDSAAGTADLNCAEPQKVGDDITTGEPECNFGRGPEECIPGAYIRTNDYPRITKDNTQDNHLYATWQDYRNGEYDIQLSQSLDGGLTWQEVGTVNPDTGLDHYFPATDNTPKGDKKGDRVGVSYYRTERVPNENTAGCTYPQPPTSCTPFTPGVQTGVGAENSDYVLAGGTGADTPYDFKVISPVFPPPDGIQAGFNGDYSGLTINKGEDAHPIWSDTRNADPYTPANGVVRDEDIFTDKVGLPNGKGKPGTGKIGKH